VTQTSEMTADPSPASPAPGFPAPRLLAHMPPPGAERGAWQTLAEHRSQYPQPPVARARPLTAITDLIDRAGLRGRGGAGFPTAVKMRSVAGGRGRAVVVANGTEGEPASYKDKLLLTCRPHLVVDGALLAAAAVGACRVVIGVEETAGEALGALRRAVAERAAWEPSGLVVEVVATPPGYVSGEESALVGFLNGGPALPTAVPPRPFEKGVGRRPTLVQNVETLAHVAQIARRGASWFREAGSAEEPGTMLVSISGAVARPGVLEVPIGVPLGAIVSRAVPLGGVSAALVGGFYGTWVGSGDFSASFSRAGLSCVGASPGAGVVIVLGEGRCGLWETARIMAWYARQGAGQCGPCVFGLGALASEMAALSHGAVPEGGLARLQRWGGQVEGRGACRHPDGSVRLARSALRAFPLDLEAHLGGRPCAGSLGAGAIPVPGECPGHPGLSGGPGGPGGR
jgi:NADH:ubiquinone oxidoreductase subunit F (NADH-binding)